ncbi:MAG: ATP-binding protein [Evtepia sp.]
MYDPNIWFHVIQFIIFMLPVCLMLHRIFEKNLRVDGFWFWFTVFGYTVVVAFVIAIFMAEISPYRAQSRIGAHIIIVISLIAIKIVIKRGLLSLLFVFFVLLNVQYSTFLLAKATLDYGILPQIFSYAYGDLMLFALIYYFLMLPIVYYLLVKQYKRIADENIAGRHINFFFCLPAGFYFAVSMLMRISMDTAVGATKEMLFPLMFTNICVFISYYAALQAIIVSYDVSMEREKLYVAQSQIVLWEEHDEKLQFQIESDARARHDWRHHIVTVFGFVEQDDMNGLKEYLDVFKEEYMVSDGPPICDVVALDMIFQYYKRKAKEQEIEMAMSQVILKGSRVEVSDLTVLFGNLLENAMEACEKLEGMPKYINLKVRRKAPDLIAIICENSFDGVIKKRDRKIVTRKEIGGIGLSSIESIAEKYRGSMHISSDDQIFKVYIAIREK